MTFLHFFFSFLFHYHSCCIFVLHIVPCLPFIYYFVVHLFLMWMWNRKKTENDIKKIFLCLMSIGGCEHSTFLYAVVLIVVASVQCVIFKHQNVIACHIMDQDFQRPGKTHSIRVPSLSLSLLSAGGKEEGSFNINYCFSIFLSAFFAEIYRIRKLFAPLSLSCFTFFF